MIYRLSVGEISTIIAAVVFVARFILPNAFALVLVRLLGQQENAATWSFTQRSLSNTHWPVILRTDSMANKVVNTRVRILNWLQILVTIILSVAAILTPAGLYDIITEGTTPSSTNDEAFTVTSNSSGYFEFWDGSVHHVSVNKSRATIYQSGLKDQQNTVSSFFDIKPRRIKRSVGDGVIKYVNTLPVDSYHFIQSVVDADRYQIFESVVVDAKAGGVGLRNHTIPENVPLGTTWTEDLLFLDLDVSCVDLNVSFVFNVSFVNNSAIGDAVPYQLVDKGGFANLDPELLPGYPSITQQDLSLSERAAVTAYWTLYWTMMQPFMNLSTLGVPDPKKSSIGQEFASRDLYGAQVTQPDAIALQPVNGALYSGIPGYSSFSANDTSPAALGASEATAACTGYNMTYHVNISSIPVTCQILIGAPTTLSGEPFAVAEEGMALKRKIYAYSAAIKATIKTVQFVYNTTDGTPLEGLQVLDIQPKNYSNESSMPLWAIETPPLYNGNMKPLWGLVSKDYEDVANISTFRSPQVYPVFWPSGYGVLSSGSDYVADNYLTGSSALTALLEFVTTMDYTSLGIGPDCRYNNGQNSALMLRRWQSLSTSAESASSIIKLIFTNMAASFVQGGRGWLSEDVVPPPYRNLTEARTSATVLTYDQQRTVRFKWPYGIPAFLSVLLIMVLVLVATGFAVTGSIHRVGRFLALLSAGRLLVDLLPEGANEANYQEDYKRWTRTNGRRRIQSFAWGWKPMSPSSPWPLETYPSGYGGDKAVATTAVSDMGSSTVRETIRDESRPFLRNGRS